MMRLILLPQIVLSNRDKKNKIIVFTMVFFKVALDTKSVASVQNGK